MKLLLLLWIQAVASQTAAPQTASPVQAPADVPTGSPKPSPTPSLSRQPTGAPSNNPTTRPSGSPTLLPSIIPSLSSHPSDSPSKFPTFSVSPAPSDTPTASPKPSPSPSSTPTKAVFPTSSKAPSSVPTSSLVPSASPTAAPSSFSPPPTQSPKPSPAPSSDPTRDFPSTQPTASPKPSPSPSAIPTSVPSMLPSISLVPTKVASSVPSAGPSVSIQPSSKPSSSPSSDPSLLPSVSPSFGPSSSPSALPSKSMKPSSTPSVVPSLGPTALPSVMPSLSQSPSYGDGTLVGIEVDFELPRCPPVPSQNPLAIANYYTVDVDGDGIKDAFGGKVFKDLGGNKIQVVCLALESTRADFEYHVLVNGKSVAKSPWLGGRNKLWIYGLDFDLDGTIEYADDDTAIALMGVLWESQDGPLPGEAFLNASGNEVVYAPNPNITEFNQDIYNAVCDDDHDGLIDISIYRYMIGDRNAVKTHFEQSTRTFARQATFPDPFVPGTPDTTPDDFLDQQMANAPLSTFPEVIDLITMKSNLFEEPSLLYMRSEEELVYSGLTYGIQFDLTNGLLFGYEILNGAIKVFFQPAKDPFEGVVKIPFNLIEALGFGVGYPADYTVTGDITSVARAVAGEYETFSVSANSTALVTMTIAYEAPGTIEDCTPDGDCTTGNLPEVCMANGTVTFQKCCCFLGCTNKVGLTDACPGICFSSHMTVQEESKGVIPIDQINIGDKILANDRGTYDTVYSWSHFQPNKQAEFLQLTAKASNQTVTVELSDDHMVFVNNRAIPASQVQLGDSLHLKSGMLANVTTIETVLRMGQFAPLTTSGTIIVNDVLSSVYVSLQGSDSLELVPGVSSPISMQWVAHTFTTLRRWKCANIYGACTDELHHDGLADWIAAPLSFCLWFLNKQSAVLQLLILVPGLMVGFLLWVIDTLPRWLLLTAGIYYYCYKKTRSHKEKVD